MRLSAQDRRSRLLEAALELFSRQGYDGTTTRQIAHKAGVTEAMVFRHFPKKEDLYWAVLDGQCNLHAGRSKVRELLSADLALDDAQVFSSIAEDILRRNTNDGNLSRLLLFSALENHKLSERFFRTYISDYYEAVADRIRKRIRTGEFRNVDPMLAARGFIGMIFYHYLIQELFGGKKYQKFDLHKVSKTLTQLWLEGLSNGNRQHLANGAVSARVAAMPHVMAKRKRKGLLNVAKSISS